MLRFLDTWAHRHRRLIPRPLFRWICDRYDDWLLEPVKGL